MVGRETLITLHTTVQQRQHTARSPPAGVLRQLIEYQSTISPHRRQSALLILSFTSDNNDAFKKYCGVLSVAICCSLSAVYVSGKIAALSQSIYKASLGCVCIPVAPDNSPENIKYNSWNYTNMNMKALHNKMCGSPCKRYMYLLLSQVTL